MSEQAERDRPPSPASTLQVFAVFLRLGLTSFGGPVAHLGFIHAECVARRRWLDERTYVDILALCQFLPGPASSQVCVSLGILRAGLSGGVAAWLGFTLPSAVALILFAEGVGRLGGAEHAVWLRGLGAVSVAIVAQALVGMAKRLCPDHRRAAMAAAAAVAVFVFPSPVAQVATIAIAAIMGLILVDAAGDADGTRLRPPTGRRPAVAALVLFCVTLLVLPPAASLTGSHALDLVARFYRAGALVFGGGHVVLPLLHDAVVPQGWIGDDAFLAGYGATQAVPGPLFAFAAYLGAAMGPRPNGWLGAILCLVSIYCPSFLLLIGVLPFWNSLRRQTPVRAAMRGVNAAVVGLLLAAFVDPVLSHGIGGPRDAFVAVTAYLLLSYGHVPPWIVVIGGAFAG